MTEPLDKTAQPKCVARRHIAAAQFKTYDAVLAVALAGRTARKEKGEDPGDLVFNGRVTRLANMNDRNESVERDNIEKLITDGWLVLINTEDQRRKSHAGTYTTNSYRVLTHAEFIADHQDSCPPPRYDDNGKLVKGGAYPRPLHKESLREFMRKRGVVFEDDGLGNQLLDAVIDQPTAAGEPATVTKPDLTTVAGEPALVTVTTAAGKPATVTPTVAGEPATTVAGEPATTAAGVPATRCVVLAPSIKPPSTILPACAENERADGRREGGSCNQEQEQPQDPEHEPELTDDELAKIEKQERHWHWTELLKSLPEEMVGAVATKEQQEEVIDQLTKSPAYDWHRFYFAAIKEWVLKRDMPIEDRRYNKWGCWLDEGATYVATQRKAQAVVMRRVETEACHRDLTFLYPDMKLRVSNGCDVRTAWLVVRRCATEKAVDVYQSEDTARERTLLPCRAGCDGDHEVKSMLAVRSAALKKKYGCDEW